MRPQNKELFFSFLLLCTAAIWGSAFLLMKSTIHCMPQNYILAIRFTVAFLGLGYFLYTARHNFSWRLIGHGALTGTLLYLAFAVQTYGLSLTTTSKNALITGGYVVLVPFLLWLCTREQIPRRTIICAITCFAGVCLISPNSDFTVNLGDVLSLVGCFFYAAHIVSVAICSKTSELMPLTCLQFGFTAIWSWIAALSFEAYPATISGATWASIAWLTLAATLGAMTMMNIGIRYVSSTRTALLLSTESLFGCIFGIYFANDPFTIQIALGGSLIIVSIIVSQLASASDSKSQSSVPANNQPHSSPPPPTPHSSFHTAA